MSVNNKRNSLIVSLSSIQLFLLAGCSTFSSSTPASDPSIPAANSAPKEAVPSESAELHKIISELNGRFQILETKLISINDKLDSTRQTLDRLTAEQKNKAPNAEGMVNQPSAEAGTPVEPSISVNDPEYGFINDSAVQLFRKALIFFHAQKYSEATLEFSNFVENYPDHPLAGSAQFYVGESYFKQKEYKLALQEYQRILTSYDKSTHISDTLGRIVLAEEALKKQNDADKYRQLLSSLFPLSPALDELNHTPEAPVNLTPEPKVEPSRVPSTPPGSHLDPVPTAPLTAPAEEKQKAVPAAEEESQPTQ